MIEVINKKREAVAGHCRGLNVRWLDVFGSAANGTTQIQTGQKMRLLYFAMCGVLPSVAFTTTTNHVNGGGAALQNALASANPGEVLLVGPGIYNPITRTDNAAILIISTDGADETLIDGGSSQRCATLATANGEHATRLAGFTLFNGKWTEADPCVEGAGGGAYGGTLEHCVVSNNTARVGGGAASSVLLHCIIKNNSAEHGGGLYGGNADNCLIHDNTATGANGGGGAHQTILNNCTVTRNRAPGFGGIVGGAANNSIVWGNTLPNGTTEGNYNTAAAGGAPSPVFNHSCASPDPGGANTGDNPMFVNNTGNFRLRPGSPCIDTGDNTLATWPLDLDGKPRVLGGTVEMGAYEFNNVWYVDIKRPDNNSDGNGWPTAKKNIQAAANLAAPGDIVIVNDGTYEFIDAAGKPLRFVSVNGAARTIIDGGGTNYCVRLHNFSPKGSLTGFTIKNGSVYGVLGGFVSHCVITENNGTGALSCELYNCFITKNTAGGAGESHLVNCLLANNTALSSGSGANWSVLRNCTVAGNRTTSINPNSSALNSCMAVINCIVWGNTMGDGSVNNHRFTTGMHNTCTTQLSGEPGCFEADPMFVNAAKGDYRLKLGSPCIGMGDYFQYFGSLYYDYKGVMIVERNDLGGRPRVVNNTIDMGAYAFYPTLHTLHITDIIMGEKDNGLVKITLPFEYGDTLKDTTLNVKIWPELGGAHQLRQNVPFNDNQNGTAVLSVTVDAESPKAFFQIEAVEGSWEE